MKIKDILQTEVKETHHNIEVLFGCYYNHMDIEQYELDMVKLLADNKKEKTIELKVHSYVEEDSRRFYMVASVHFAGVPFMIICNAGREGDDYSNKYIFDIHHYETAQRWLNNYRIQSKIHMGLKTVDDFVCVDFYGRKFENHVAGTPNRDSLFV